MKTTLLALFLLLSGQNAFSKTLIISDIDDTVKITDVLNKKNMIYNALFNKAAFSGMAQLYRELVADQSDLYYISGSPAFIEEKVTAFLEFNKFPHIENLILKSGLKINNYDYKVDRISNLINEQRPEKVILIGDDTEFDPEAFQAIMIKFPGIVETAYIRSIQNRKLPDNEKIKRFFSAVEIAGHEFMASRFNSKGLLNVARAYLQKNDGSRLFIKDRFCPAQGSVELDGLIKELSSEEEILAVKAVQERIRSACKGQGITSRSQK